MSKRTSKPRTVETFPAPEDVACPSCGKHALTRLPTLLLASQPDDTNIVCNPAHGGCNSGFATEAWYTPAQARAALGLPVDKRPSWARLNATDYAARLRSI